MLFWEKNPTWRLKNKKKMRINAGLLQIISLTPYVDGPPAVHKQQMQMQQQMQQQQQMQMQHQRQVQGFGQPSAEFPSNINASMAPSQYGAVATNSEFPSSINASMAPGANYGTEFPSQINAAAVSQYPPQSIDQTKGLKPSNSPYGQQPGQSMVNLEKKPEQTMVNLQKKPQDNRPSYAIYD